MWGPLMSYVRTFLPWIVFAAVPSTHWQWGALAALLVAVVVVAQQRRTGVGFDALIMETGSAVYFAILAAVAFADPHSATHAYSAALSSATLALIAGTSLLMGKPFTLGIAKRTTPPEVWRLKPFIRVNVVITTVWTAAFGATAVALAVLAHMRPRPLRNGDARPGSRVHRSRPVHRALRRRCQDQGHGGSLMRGH